MINRTIPGLSVIVPVFNEVSTIERVLARISTVPIAGLQIIVVDDGSVDGTVEVLRRLRDRYMVVFHGKNAGKSRAIRSGLKMAISEFVTIQDGDLEYDPHELPALLDPLVCGQADLVLGSRYLGRRSFQNGVLFLVGVKVLNILVWAMYGVRVSDEATCYKVIQTRLLQMMDLRGERFEFCPEVIAKACRMGLRIKEVPISYHPRTAKQGKKIRLRDGWSAIKTLWRYRKWEPRPENKLSEEDKLPVVSCQTENKLPFASCQLPDGENKLSVASCQLSVADNAASVANLPVEAPVGVEVGA